MARFVLDVANCSKAKIDKIMFDLIEDVLSGEVATITCIDETNDNQFHNDQTLNKLSEKQIDTYNKLITNP